MTFPLCDVGSLCPRWFSKPILQYPNVQYKGCVWKFVRGKEFSEEKLTWFPKEKGLYINGARQF